MPPSPPPGTRDLYPLEAARRRFLTEAWRRVSIRHGFEEVDGPTFEHADLYAVKSGEGILGELFQAFSGKSPEEVERVKQSGRGPYALRPEFTPTLARMYAARAASLPKPAKWFMAGPFFRAERPQRGRLREFLQWNVDVLGLDIPQEMWNVKHAASREAVAEAKARMDAECISCCVAFLETVGLTPADVRVRLNDRAIVENWLHGFGVERDRVPSAFALLDQRERASSMGELASRSKAAGIESEAFLAYLTQPTGTMAPPSGVSIDAEFSALRGQLEALSIAEWIDVDLSIVRGLAYYTGTVFEVIALGERAVAGGGRYDNLVELFGGPPTPAVGFAMGDVVISLLLQDKGLMPKDEELMEAAGARPDAFVIAAKDDLDGAVLALLSRLRREGLHARRSYKATRNVGKLLKDAAAVRARIVIILESPTTANVKHLDRAEQQGPMPLDEAVEIAQQWTAERIGEP
ncbi:MAG: ATP phosphoribosyltransferase regulatory subunit [Phycisphaeraceae bacterium]|nr:ATP phosphoribosyltransferase regulatory subunit [Phycisphaeraceae bacterium]